MFFNVGYVSRGTLPKKKVKKGTTGGQRLLGWDHGEKWGTRLKGKSQGAAGRLGFWAVAGIRLDRAVSLLDLVDRFRVENTPLL